MSVVLWATFLLLGSGESIQAQEALAFLGGRYLDGYLDNEIEVWSHSSECGLDIPSTPDFFVSVPGVALFHDHIYVCGGDRVGTTHTHDTCDIYSLKDKVWSQGLSLKSNSTNVYLATVGDRLLAAYRNEDENLVVSFMDSEETGWTETFPLDSPFPQPWFSFVPLNEKYVAINSIYAYYPFDERIHILDVHTGEVVTISLDWHCDSPTMYNNNYTCVRTNEYLEGNELVSLTEVFTTQTWTVVGTIPPKLVEESHLLAVLDGMLTVINIQAATLYYLEGVDWKMGELDFPKQDTSFLVIPCNQ